MLDVSDCSAEDTPLVSDTHVTIRDYDIKLKL